MYSPICKNSFCIFSAYEQIHSAYYQHMCRFIPCVLILWLNNFEYWNGYFLHSFYRDTASKNSMHVSNWTKDLQGKIIFWLLIDKKKFLSTYSDYTRVAEPKLFFSALAPAPAPTFKKFRLWLRSWLRLRLELWGCLFSQLLNEKVDFSWLFGKNIDCWSYSIWIMIKYTTLVSPGAGAGSRSRNFSIPAPAPTPAKSFGSGRLQLRLRLLNPGLYTDLWIPISWWIQIYIQK